MFSLANQAAALLSVNPRADIRGDEHVTAADVMFGINVSNDVLSEFDPALKSALYKKADGPQRDLIQDVGHLPKLKFPLMGEVKWAKKLSGYDVLINRGFVGPDEILLIGCVIDKFRFHCREGGDVSVTFRVTAHPGPNELGRLCELIQTEVKVTLGIP